MNMTFTIEPWHILVVGLFGMAILLLIASIHSRSLSRQLATYQKSAEYKNCLKPGHEFKPFGNSQCKCGRGPKVDGGRRPDLCETCIKKAKHAHDCENERNDPHLSSACQDCGKPGPHSLLRGQKPICSNDACDAKPIGYYHLNSFLLTGCYCDTCKSIDPDKNEMINARRAWHLLSIHYRAGNDKDGIGEEHIHIPMTDVIRMYRLTGIIKLPLDHPFYEICLLKDFDPRKQFPCPCCGHPRPQLPKDEDEHDCPYCTESIDACSFNDCPSCCKNSLVLSDDGDGAECTDCGFFDWECLAHHHNEDGVEAYFNMPAKGVIAANVNENWDSTILHVGHPANA